MIACCIRVSTTSQNSEGQKKDVRRWLKGQGHKAKDVQWFEDKETGKHTDRPAFKKLQQAVFMGELKTIVVWRLDRLSRNQRDGINTLADWCEKGVRVARVTQQLDLSGATGRLIAGVLFAVDEMELEAIKERQAAGIANAKAKAPTKRMATDGVAIAKPRTESSNCTKKATVPPRSRGSVAWLGRRSTPI